jgi:hypothetical protein
MANWRHVFNDENYEDAKGNKREDRGPGPDPLSLSSKFKVLSSPV